MEIRWFGQSCFQIKAKEGTIVTDPYNDEVGWKLPQLRADILTISHDHFDHNAKDKVEAEHIFDAPGEYEANNMSILGVLADHDEEQGTKLGKVTIFKFLLEGMSVLHLGDLGTKLSDMQLNEIGAVDIVLVPVGGNYTIDAQKAIEVVKSLDPKIVIPMHYKLPGLKPDIKEADNFISKIGLAPERIDLLRISKPTLPEEGMRLVVLNKVNS